MSRGSGAADWGQSSSFAGGVTLGRPVAAGATRPDDAADGPNPVAAARFVLSSAAVLVEEGRPLCGRVKESRGTYVACGQPGCVLAICLAPVAAGRAGRASAARAGRRPRLADGPAQSAGAGRHPGAAGLHRHQPAAHRPGAGRRRGQGLCPYRRASRNWSGCTFPSMSCPAPAWAPLSAACMPSAMMPIR